jgi:GrpB-like predicted nucleotidyltransferase (UPF0157 family)
MVQQRAVQIVDYDSQWPLAFRELSDVIAEALGELALAIEHVGSTSVPGLAAKPIIDLDVVISSRDVLSEVIDSLRQLGYTHQGPGAVCGREQFAREGCDVPRTDTGRVWPDHHLYVCAQNNPELIRHIAFRDYLRSHPDEARAYDTLKRQLAKRFRHDRDAYGVSKTEFIEGILERVLS